MIVFALTKVPNSLRGDLTKWCQEIQTGIYVGNFSAKIRDLIWQRINRNIGSGEATMVYTTNNELGYTFLTTKSDYKVVDFDGIPFMKHLDSVKNEMKLGFSEAAKYHRAKIARRDNMLHVAAIDIETTGLDITNSKIISIGSVKTIGKEVKKFYRVIKINKPLSKEIVELTRLTDDDLSENGISLKEALVELKEFIGNSLVIGYNINFDFSFLNKAYRENNLESLNVQVKDLMMIIKRKDRFLDNYRLETVLKKYGIINEKTHNSLADAEATLELYKKLK